MSTVIESSEKKRLTTEQKAQAIAMYIEGTPQKDIAKGFGVSQQAISQMFCKDDMRQIIESANQELILRTITPTIENMHWLVTSYRKTTVNEDGKSVPVLCKEQLNHAWDAQKEVLKATGITPYPTQPILVQNIYNDNRQQLISPVMWEVIKKYAESFKLNGNEGSGNGDEGTVTYDAEDGEVITIER